MKHFETLFGLLESNIPILYEVLLRLNLECIELATSKKLLNSI